MRGGVHRGHTPTPKKNAFKLDLHELTQHAVKHEGVVSEINTQHQMMEDGQNISIAEQNRLKSRRRSQEIEAARLEEYEGSRAKPESYSGVLRWYLILSNRMYGVAKSAWFDNFIMAVILTASIMISIETYDGMEGNLTLLVINLIILAIFTVEVVVKLIAQSLKPWLYFMGPQRMWNIFDFSIVVMSYTLEGNSIAALRLLRLCRLVKLVNKIPKLRTLIEGLFAGLSQIGYIALLMCLIFYIFAILGILLFRENDPAHWENLGMAGVTLFRCATLEDWTDVFYINFFGCEDYDNAGAYSMDFNASLVNKTIGSGGITRCASPIASPVTATIYFFLFIIVSSMVLLSMFIGAITISMSECVARMNRETKAANLIKMQKQEAALKLEQSATSKWKIARKTLATGALKKENSLISLGASVRDLGSHLIHDLTHDSTTLTIAEKNKQARVNALIKECFTGEKAEWVTLKESTALRQAYSVLARKCYALTKTVAFQSFILGVILLTAIMVGMSTVEEFKELDWYRSLTHFWDWFAIMAFTLELVIRIIAEEFHPMFFLFQRGNLIHPMGWNWFDSIIVIGTWVPGSGDMVIILRLLRLLMVFKLITKFPKMRLAVDALLNGFISIGYVGILLTLTFYFFAIFAIILFKYNDPWHFGNLHLGMITLFRMATLEDWTDVMYINQYGCNEWIGYKENNLHCEHSYAFGYVSNVFCIIFTVFGSLIMLNLFIGVIVTSMEEALTDMQGEMEGIRQVKQLTKQYRIGKKMQRNLREAYKMLSRGHKEIESKNLKIGLDKAGVKISELKLQDIMRVVDSDYDGLVSFVEFVSFVCLMTKSGGNLADMKKLHEKNSPKPQVHQKDEIIQLQYFCAKRVMETRALEYELDALYKFYKVTPPSKPIESRPASPNVSFGKKGGAMVGLEAGVSPPAVAAATEPANPPPRALRPSDPPPARVIDMENPMRKSLWDLEPHELEDIDNGNEGIKILI